MKEIAAELKQTSQAEEENSSIKIKRFLERRRMSYKNQTRESDGKANHQSLRFK